MMVGPSFGESGVLLVDGKPFVLLAGEVHNSTSSSLRMMERAWEKATTLAMNTLLVPISWELMEPEEGRFDFSGVDSLIDQARAHGGHLVLLWFGTWKNAQSTYVPTWVKTDLVRFPRAEVVRGSRKVVLTEFHGIPYSTLSALGDETCEADSRAFAELMGHLQSYDEGERTVLAVQVENECGLLGAARESSEEADVLFGGVVPQGLVDHLVNRPRGVAPDINNALMDGPGRGTWQEVFGACADEVFQAFCVARYVGRVAAAGRAAYQLPLTVNCWLDKGHKAGRFPSGGPVARVRGIWEWAAPCIDVFCPDIYVPTFCDDCDRYHSDGNPLFIPETATHSYLAPRAIWAIGHHHVACFSPFAFEEMGEPFDGAMGALFGADPSDPALATPQDPAIYARVNRALAGLLSQIREEADLARMDAVISERGLCQRIPAGAYALEVTFTGRAPGACLVLSAGDNSFFVLAQECSFEIVSCDGARPNVDYLVVEDGSFEDGYWVRDRRLNGDETMMMSFEEPSLLKLEVFRYA